MQVFLPWTNMEEAKWWLLAWHSVPRIYPSLRDKQQTQFVYEMAKFVTSRSTTRKPQILLDHESHKAFRK